jgi:hypothetical protein
MGPSLRTLRRICSEDLKRKILASGTIADEPDSRECSKAKLMHDSVSTVRKGIVEMDGMVTTWPISVEVFQDIDDKPWT